MSHARRALLGVLAVALLHAAPTTAQTPVIPAPGWYEGYDRAKHKVTFYYSRSHGLQHITIAGTHFGSASVQGRQWHHTCYQGRFCTRGQWTASHHVSGIWNDSHQAGEGHFNATWRGN